MLKEFLLTWRKYEYTQKYEEHWKSVNTCPFPWYLIYFKDTWLFKQNINNVVFSS